MVNEPNIIKWANGKPTRVSLTDELTNGRILTLDRGVDWESVSPLIKTMLVLEHEDPKAPITLLISSPGGDIYAGMALIDVMRGLDCPVTTIAAGLVASMAAVILANGDHRMAYPHAQILIHQLMGSSGGQQTDVEIMAMHMSEMRQTLDELLASKSNRTAAEFRELTERDCWCSAERALELGLIDEIFEFPVKEDAGA